MTQTPRRTRKRTQSASHNSTPTWSDDTELVGLVFELSSSTDGLLPLQYAVGLHAWFLDRVRQIDPDLSAYLHDGESEKAFTISGLNGVLIPQGRQLQVAADRVYRWYVTGLSQRVVQWLVKWMQALPAEVSLRDLPLKIISCQVAQPPTTYANLLSTEIEKTLTLSFVSPTSFRRKGHHFPLPMPINLFHSYLRRWNDFSGLPFEQDAFLEWVDEGAIIHRHQLSSCKVQAGKKGSVTGFTGAIELGLSSKARENSQFVQLFYALGELAIYCGTGHKTTFGLGQTCKGWIVDSGTSAASSMEDVLANRIAELTEIFTAQRKRTGGNRTAEIAETWATILGRREFGESLQDIATDLDMPYETVKTYVKLARRTLKAE